MIALIALLFSSSYPLSQISWVKTQETIKVALVQANISGDIKWQTAYDDMVISQYMNMTQQVADSDLIMWPETALPIPMQEKYADIIIKQLQAFTAKHQNILMTGAAVATGKKFHNSLVAINGYHDLYIYNKHILLPFGEYTPFIKYFPRLSKLFNIPMSGFIAGKKEQKIFSGNNIKASIYICYEDMFPNYVRTQAADANLLITISDDIWLGDTLGPYQHLHNARVRAAELGRYFVRSTNTGVSAIIDEHGKITHQSDTLFTQDIIKGQVLLLTGKTPFARYGSWPVVFVCLLILLGGIIMRWRTIKCKKMQPYTDKHSNNIDKNS